jgi:hypothetical protein
MRWFVPAAAFLALASAAVPAQSGPLSTTSVTAGKGFEHGGFEQAHYRRHRHYRHYRYYRRPGIHFYIAPHRHRHWRHRHHHHW